MEGTVKRSYYVVDEVEAMLGVSEGKAYQIMRKLRAELISKNLLTPDYPHGKVPRKYFEERCAIDL